MYSVRIITVRYNARNYRHCRAQQQHLKEEEEEKETPVHIITHTSGKSGGRGGGDRYVATYTHIL